MFDEEVVIFEHIIQEANKPTKYVIPPCKVQKLIKIKMPKVIEVVFLKAPLLQK